MAESDKASVMGMAQNALQHVNDIRREAFDAVPRTVLCSGVVFLSLVVPLYFNQDNAFDAPRVCFRISAISMFLSLLCSGLLFKRSIRASSEAIQMLTPVAKGKSDATEIEVRLFDKLEWGAFVVMSLSFVVAMGVLIVAMFV